MFTIIYYLKIQEVQVLSQEELNKQATEQNNTETEIEDIKEDIKVVKNDEYTIKSYLIKQMM